MTTRFLLCIAVSGFGAAGLFAQRLDLANQGRNVDFASAAATRPFKSGTTLPSTCKVGDAFFKTDGVPGFNYFGCTSENVWTLQNGTGSSSVSELAVERVSATQLTVAPGRWSTGAESHTTPGATANIITLPVSAATNANPIVVTVSSTAALRTGDTVVIAGITGNTAANGVFTIALLNGTQFQLVGAVGNGNYSGGGTVGGTGNGMIYVFGSEGGSIQVDHASSAGLIVTCAGNCVTNQVASPSMPANAVPLGIATVVSGSIVTISDQRSFLTNRGVTAGLGILVNDIGGNARVSVDSTVARMPNANIWTGANSFTAATRTAPFRTGITAPTGQTCAEGDTFWQTSAPANEKLWVCVATDTWRPYTAAGGAQMPVMEDEFLSSAESANDFGALRWRGAGDKAPVAEQVPAGIAFHHPGTYAVSTNATVGSGSAMTLRAANGTQQLAGLGSTTGWLMEAILVTDSVSPAAMNIRFGLADDPTAENAANAVELRWRNNTACTVTGADTNWTFHNRAGGVSTATASAVAPAASQSVRVRVRSLTAGVGLYSMSVNGGAFSAEVAVAGLPTAPVSPYFAVHTCAGMGKKVYADYFRFVPGTLQR